MKPVAPCSSAFRTLLGRAILCSWVALGASATAQSTLSSPSFQVECAAVAPAIDSAASTSFQVVAVVGGTLTGELSSSAFAVSLGVLCADPGCGTTLCGDCNLDGVVTILDSLTAARHAAGAIVLVDAQFANCDVDESGVVDILDSLRLAQFAAGLPVAFSCC